MTFCPRDGAPLGVAMLDRYELVRPVAHTGMGEVFEARHSHTGRRVAVKVINKSLAENHDVGERLRREGRATSSIGDPNIVDVTDFGSTDDGTLYMVMEWLSGSTLRDILDAGPVPPMDALDIAAQTAKGLASAHNIGVVHRDVKPSNLMVVEKAKGKRQVKILDFGIAKIMTPGVHKLTRTGTIMGTPAYMSPEQARAIDIDRRTDIYSLGCILYELFTGTPPFSDLSPMKLVLLHASSSPELPSQRAPKRGIPAQLDTLIMRCLEKNRERRYSSMSELQDALQALADPRIWTLPATSPATSPDEMDAARTLLFLGNDVPVRAGARPSTQPPPQHSDYLPPPQKSPRTLWISFGMAAVVGIVAAVLLGSGDDSKAEPRVAAVSSDAGEAMGVADELRLVADAAVTGATTPMIDAGTTEAEPKGVWKYERVHSKFRITLSASPRPLMPREPIEINIQLDSLKEPLSWAVTEGRLRAELSFVHFVRHDTLGEVTGAVDDSGHFRVIFSVPQTGKYHLKIRLKDGSKVVGRTQIDLCVGIDPEDPDLTSLCPQFNLLTKSHGPAR